MKPKTTEGKGIKKIYYKVNDNCEYPMICETLEGALDYLKDCLDGIGNKCPISIEKIEMTSDDYKQLPEL